MNNIQFINNSMGTKQFWNKKQTKLNDNRDIKKSLVCLFYHLTLTNMA
jgi:hypothetical protein